MADLAVHRFGGLGAFAPLVWHTCTRPEGCEGRLLGISLAGVSRPLARAAAPDGDRRSTARAKGYSMAGPSVGLSQDTSLKEGGGAGCSAPLANGSPPLGRLTHLYPPRAAARMRCLACTRWGGAGGEWRDASFRGLGFASLRRGTPTLPLTGGGEGAARRLRGVGRVRG